MRTISVTLVLLSLSVSAAAQEPTAETRVFGAKIVSADAKQIVAGASFELTGTSGRECELILRVRGRKGEVLKQADGTQLALSFGPVTIPEGENAATWKGCRFTLDPSRILLAPNLPHDRLPLRLLLEFSLFEIVDGKRIPAAPAVATPLEIYRSPDDEILNIEHMGTWLKDLEGPVDDAVHEAARTLLITYGEAIPEETRRRALSALVALFGNDDLNEQVLSLVTALGEQAVKPLVMGLESREPMKRAWCGIGLLHLGTYGRAATLVLFEGMRHAIREEEAYALRTLANALEKINPKAIGAAEVLSVAIEDPTLRLIEEGAMADTTAVCAAINALSKLGTAARPAIPILRRALTDPDEDVRAAAKTALNKLHK